MSKNRLSTCNGHLPVLRLFVLVLLSLSTFASRVYAADDASTVAALDIEYQAAVAKNDESTMSRILAEDFVLITGTGKTFRCQGRHKAMTPNPQAS
jgi:hypothetical protein